MEYHVGSPTIFGTYRPRPEYVVRLADTLEIDRILLMSATGYSNPSPARWRILEALAAGVTRQGLGASLGVAAASVSRWLKDFDSAISPDSINKIDRYLGLSQAAKDAEMGAHLELQELANRRRSAALAGRNTGHLDPANSRRRMNGIWHDPPARRERIQRIREAMETRKIRINKEWLRNQLAQGLSYTAIAKRAGVCRETVRMRSIEYGFREGETYAQRHQRRKRSKQLNEDHQRKAAGRQEVAERLLAELDDGCLLRLSVRKFEDLIADADPSGKGITKSAAESMLREAKARARARLTIAS